MSCRSALTAHRLSTVSVPEAESTAMTWGHLGASEDGNVLQVGLPGVPKPGGLDSAQLDPPPQLVEDEGGQGLALHILRDDQQRPLGLNHALQYREQGLQPAASPCKSFLIQVTV